MSTPGHLNLVFSSISAIRISDQPQNTAVRRDGTSNCSVVVGGESSSSAAVDVQLALQKISPGDVHEANI